MKSSSSSLVLDNIDDYLAPSQACINPLFQPPTDAAKRDDEKKTNKIAPRRRRRRPLAMTRTDSGLSPSGNPSAAIIPRKKKEAVKASIVDCLACSGCVTTAETVLLEQRHSLDSLRKRLHADSNSDRRRVITVSPNSWADICRHWKLPSDEHNNYCRFTTLLNKILNAILVVDGNLPLLWTWMDEAQEFVDLYRKQEDQQHEVKKTKPLPSVAVDASKTLYYQSDGTTKTVLNVTDDQNQTTMPLISGSCPALVCLVEKNMNDLVPNLSQSQSPMSRLGSILKENNRNWDHWAIMPCHDKKLEASRQDFVDLNKANGVDLVITTNECIELVEEWIQKTKNSSSVNNDVSSVASYFQTLSTAQHQLIDNPDDLSDGKITPSEPTFLTTSSASLLFESSNQSQNHILTADQMAFSSGGHADFIFRYATKVLFGVTIDVVEWKASILASNKVVKSARLAKAQKNHYYKAKLFRTNDGTYTQTAPSPDQSSGIKPILDFAIAHGMQTMQRALKEVSATTSLNYMEAMACPFGCVNGGGAVKTSIGRETPTETRQRVQLTIEHLDLPHSKQMDLSRVSPLRTRFHIVPPMQHTIGAAAGVKVDDILW
jgi:iron only hydrogenase large subunit-like protein